MLRTIFTLFLTTSVLFILYVLTSNENQPKIHYTYQQPTTKYILFWNKAGSSDRLYFPSTGHELFRNCIISDCFATSDRNLLPIQDYDAIIFHAPRTGPPQNESLPSYRKPEQPYVFAAFEAPSRFSPGKVRYLLNDFYNLTMSYRFDSDLVRRHGYVEKAVVEDYELPSRVFVKGKTRNVAWMVSNCDTPGRREVLVKELAKYIDVDVYGRCGEFSCDKSSNDACLEMIERKYKYYLSFENSHCRDYTTEKFYNILNKSIVPIVYGGGDYEDIAPPNSYINVEDFLDVKSLAEYLKTLAADEDRYLKYFEWKKNYKIVKNSARTICQLCSMLHNPDGTHKSYDIKNWWFHPKKAKCHVGSALPPIVRNLL